MNHHRLAEERRRMTRPDPFLPPSGLLQHGDVVTATIATDDGALDLGRQRTPVDHL
jgi:hypothetical protein